MASSGAIAASANAAAGASGLPAAAARTATLGSDANAVSTAFGAGADARSDRGDIDQCIDRLAVAAAARSRGPQASAIVSTYRCVCPFGWGALVVVAAAAPSRRCRSGACCGAAQRRPGSPQRLAGGCV